MATMRAPARVRTIESAAEIKALSDPLRLKVLRLLMGDHGRSWTVKEIAAALQQPVTKLYHHVNLLAEVGLIRDVETRMVSGIAEHRYASAARSLEFDDTLLGSPETRDASLEHVANLLDENRDSLLDYVSRDEADLDRVLVHQGRPRLTTAEAEELNEKIIELLSGFEKRRRTKSRQALSPTRVLLVIHPEVPE